MPILTGNRVETIEAMLAVARAGGLGLPLPVARRPVQSGSATARLTIMIGESPELRHFSGRVAALEDLATTPPRTPARDDVGIDEPAWLLRVGATQLLATQRSTVWPVLACLDLLCARDPRPVPLPVGCAHLVCLLGVLAVGASARLASPPADDPTGHALFERVDPLGGTADGRPLLGLTVPTPAPRPRVMTNRSLQRVHGALGRS